jgi:WD40 repeat protein
MELSPPLSTNSGTAGTAKRRVDDQTILVSSNDSRLRAYLLRDKSESVKYTGHTNESSQIKASYSDDAEYIISGSEEGRCIVWSVEPPKLLSFGASTHKRVEGFEYIQVAFSGPCTAAVFAPTALQGRLQAARVRPVLPLGKPSDGRIIVTADTAGRVRVFENNPLLHQWLEPVSVQE